MWNLKMNYTSRSWKTGQLYTTGNGKNFLQKPQAARPFFHTPTFSTQVGQSFFKMIGACSKE
jgi:hypothetical protein